MKKKILGILGGMGPLASAEFLLSIYENHGSLTVEQENPDVVLYSLASTADRTAAILGNNDDNLYSILKDNLIRLKRQGVHRIIICCFTSHHFLPRLPVELTQSIVSIVDVALKEIKKLKRPVLLLASRGCYEKQVFQASKLFSDVSEYIIIPDEHDRAIVHDIIYTNLKVNPNKSLAYEKVRALLVKYNTDTFIAGCTEFHMLVRYMLSNRMNGVVSFVDPLHIIAENLEAFLDESC
ncbi:MAG: aspartate/glutamate racemase family protein [Nitrospirae bacterium]|nr:aspartate/glutamate racemase family protein [Nitrospirota bacterium]MBF0536209.1 aspartate/glutamate racemase family protein [Nitrospirota bacterium]MBF0617315.1 aspartate/glutamate racemase family protein [Nitrospirota bacterium]